MRRRAGEPLAFAVSDQGLAAPFTALRLLGTYARGFTHCRALLIILEQSTLPYDVVAPPYPPPTRDVGVALLLESGGPPAGTAGISVRRYAGVTRDRAASALVADLAAATPGDGATLLADPGLGPLPRIGGHPHRVAPSGLGCVAPWWLLAQEPVPGTTRVLAAHDPGSNELCVTTIGITRPEGGLGCP
ncbi:hypothetical protein [Phytohabitans rumicis]|uniref:hypothetical protein n=1 Tax=Phytohabitans rumicis TaxID=1076125 RepID=UPI001566DDFA|nr:hypothetical protein [Phytohabitans rumicis]